MTKIILFLLLISVIIPLLHNSKNSSGNVIAGSVDAGSHKNIEQITLGIADIAEDASEYIINDIATIINKSYVEVKNAVEFYNAHKNDESEKIITGVLATYPSINEAKIYRTKLNDIGVKCSLGTTSDLLHDDKFNVDYHTL